MAKRCSDEATKRVAAELRLGRRHAGTPRGVQIRVAWTTNVIMVRTNPLVVLLDLKAIIRFCLRDP